MRATRIIIATAIVCTVLCAGDVQAQATASPDLDARIQKLIAAISQPRLVRLMATLVSFATRNTLSDTTSATRGIGAARQWILDELTRTSSRLQVSFDVHQIPMGGRITRDVELRNVIAVLPGRSPRRIYVSGHYDTVNLGAQGQVGVNSGATAADRSDENADAPGANDD